MDCISDYPSVFYTVSPIKKEKKKDFGEIKFNCMSFARLLKTVENLFSNILRKQNKDINETVLQVMDPFWSVPSLCQLIIIIIMITSNGKSYMINVEQSYIKQGPD